jgi:glycosyltransferase involved in cell wall biosynthesis
MRSTATERRSDQRTSVELTALGGSPVRIGVDVPQDEVRSVIRLTERKDVRSGILVCKHLPATADGRDLYELTRSVQTGHWWAVGATGFPTDRVPAAWVPALNAMDEIWVPSAFNAETFARSGVVRDRIHVVPLASPVLRRPADPGRRYRLDTARSRRFLSVTRLEERKAWKELLRAWLEAFAPGDDVALVLWIEPDAREPVDSDALVARIAAWIAELGRDPADIPEITVVAEPLDPGQVADLMAQCQAFVLPSRGESWCQPMMEAFAMGLPVVATRFGGALAYLNDENAFLVDPEGLVAVSDEAARERPHFRGHRWAEPGHDSLVRSMRRIFEDPAEAARRAARAMADVAARWTAAHACARMTARLATIERAAKRPAVPARREPARVVWRAAVYDQSGYASAARAFVRGLHERGLDCKVSPVVWSARVASLGLADRLLLHELSELAAAERAICVQHYFPPQFQRERSYPVAIGRTMFETDRIPQSWVAPCNDMDELWVPSRQCVQSFSDSGVPREKLVVVPDTFDFTGYTRTGPRLDAIAPGPFTFLTVFDWQIRKGWDVLLRAWASAFAGRDDVRLVMKLQLSNGLTMDDARRAIGAAMKPHLPRGKSPAPIELVGKLPEGDLPPLYRSADAFVLPTRGEGCGRPFAEAMAVGVPAIGTRWSGQVDFMDDQNSWLIDYDLVPVSEQAALELPTFRGHRWAEPRAEHLRKLLLEARESPELLAAKGRKAEVDIRERLGPDRVIGIILDRLAHWDRRL